MASHECAVAVTQFSDSIARVSEVRASHECADAVTQEFSGSKYEKESEGQSKAGE